MSRLVAICLVVLASTACGSRDGLTDKEYGYILFWEVASSELVWTDCTDAPDFRASVMAPEFEENSFFIYRVADDGDQLIAQDCTAVDTSTCSDSTLDITFERQGDLFTYDEPLTVGGELAPGCRLTSDPLWTVDDRGQELFLDVSLTYGLQGGDACNGVDENVAAAGTNEFGIDQCVATLAVVNDYFTRRLPQ